jgi:hypothetical protein
VFHPDEEEAKRWYEKAAELGSVYACDFLGEQLYRDAVDAFGRISTGEGSEEDATLARCAFEVTKKAADAGCPCSKTRLAFMYADGMGVERDEGRAKECLLAAEQCPDTGHEHLWRERLGDKLISTISQGHYDILIRIPGRYNQHRTVRLLVVDIQELKAIHAREVDVQQYNVWLRLLCLYQSIYPCPDHLYNLKIILSLCIRNGCF